MAFYQPIDLEGEPSIRQVVYGLTTID